MQDRHVNIFNKLFLCFILFIFILMNASVSHAASYVFVTKWGSSGSGDGQFSYPCNIAVDSSGNVYVVDSTRNDIQKFNSTGTFITKWGSSGSGDGQFSSPSGIAVDSSGNIYIGDSNNNRIQKFNNTGAFISKWGSYGSDDGQFSSPSGIAVDSSGNIYIGDSNNNRIQKFNSTGTFITKWGSYGSDDGQFAYPFGVAVDSSSNVYAVDNQGHAQKFNSTGAFIYQLGSQGIPGLTFGSPHGITVDSSDNVYIANKNGDCIEKFNSTGAFITKFGSSGSGDGYLNRPRGVAVDSSDNVYVADTNNYRVEVFAKTILPEANFSANITSGYVPLSVQFNDSSTNTTEWNWDFGDEDSSTEQNPVHTYSVAGNYTVNLEVSNANGTDSYFATINVLKLVPVITWNDPDDIVYGTALNDTQLNATASINGSFIYTPESGITLEIGQHTLQADFTPEDTANYTNASKNVSINVIKATPTVTWDNPADIIYGTSLNGTQLNALASVNGSFIYTPESGITLEVGQHTLQADFTPEDTANYTNASKNVSINVTKVTPTVTWDNPADIIYGTSLNGTQLNALASVPGNFNYTPESGTVLDIGQHTLNTEFTPFDEANYTNASKNVTIRVLNANYSIFKSVIDPDTTGDCIINNAGDKVPYRIVVKNEGDVNLTNVIAHDTLISPLPEPTGDDNNDSTLNPGETWVYDTVYTLTSEDVENGSINNNATVTCDQLPGKSSSVNTTVDQNADLSIYKSVIGIDEAGDNIINEVGDIIQYRVAVKNNGNIDLTNVLVNDPIVNLTKSTGDHNDLGVLNPKETWIYAGNYSVTQEDIDRAKVGNAFIENTATVSCDQLSNESGSLVLPIIYIPPKVFTPESENSTDLPVANFSTNVTSGYAPLSVQFTDLSQNAISRSWDFNNDGSIDSTDINPVYTYLTQGTYTVNLTVNNANGSSSKPATITVQQTSSSNSGGSSGSSSGGSNGNSIGKATVVSSSSSTTTTTSASPNATQTETTTSNVVQNSTPAKAESTPIQTATETPAKEGKKTPGFELLCGITGLLAVFLYRKR